MKEEFRLIKAGTKVWSIALQENVTFEKDLPVKITNTVHGNEDALYGTLQLFLFEHAIPAIMNKVNGDIGFSKKESSPWEMPKPNLPSFKYEK